MIDESQPTAWFEPLYAKGNAEGEGVPWAQMGTHPHFQAWLAEYELKTPGQQALVVGCGLGDDAIELEQRGFDVTAFDVSETAIAYCKQRFPNSSVKFEVADLFAPPESWLGSFDFILEIYTVQALPPRYEEEALKQLQACLSPGGHLLMCTMVQDAPRSFDAGPPWLLNANHRDRLQALGLSLIDKLDHPLESGNWVYRSLFENKL